MNVPEILAPAGSYEAFLAAVHNGCDAVYLGGKAYGARAYADNFDMDTLKRAADYAAGFGVKIYYTVNTLFKEKELADLVDHVGQVLNAGADALIVQDLGVLKLIKDDYPGVELHVSTQMNCHSLEGVRFLEAQGVHRVVLARELNLEEIQTISGQTDLEIEAFVHGALCYCYSGQCLMSSFLGGRSGNRGRCAQPCRLAYKGKVAKEVYDPSHVLSPKDIETLSILPEVIGAGVNSLKIEGRMKSPAYVGLMTALYRKYRDLYLEQGYYEVSQADMDQVIQTFNRGGFSSGYYKNHSGREMITLSQPKNQGSLVGAVTGQKGSQLAFTTNLPLVAGDCLEVPLVDGGYESFILKEKVAKKGRATIEGKAKINGDLRRIKSVALVAALTQKNQVIHQRSIAMKVTLVPGAPAELLIMEKGKETRVKGDLVQVAQKQGLTYDKVAKQLRKVGDLPLHIDKLDVQMPDNAFMAVSQLNGLRRKALEAHLAIEKKPTYDLAVYKTPKVKPRQGTERNITVLSNNWYQFETLMAYDVTRIYLEWVNYTENQIKKALSHPKVLSGQVKVWLAVPRIMRHEKSQAIQGLLSTMNNGIEGFLVRSIDSLGHVVGLGKKIRFDYGMNLMNQPAVALVMGSDNASGYMPSLELKYGELRGLDLREAEVLIYGHVKSMVSAQCVRKTLSGCEYDQGHILTMEDRKGMDVPVETNCLLCYNLIYNGTPLYLGDKIPSFTALGVRDYRLDFVNEKEEDIDRIMTNITSGNVSPMSFLSSYTRGHYNKGVE